MSEVGTIEGPLDAGTLRRLSQIDPWRSTWAIVWEWGAIFGAIALCPFIQHPVLYGIAIMWIGARQHALGVLMHEASHRRLYRTRWLNDGIGELLLAWPIFMSMRGYAALHTAHHRHVNTSEDPDWVRKQTDEWVFPMPRRKLLWLLLKDLLGLNTLQLLGRARAIASANPRSGGDRTYQVARLGFHLLQAVVLTQLHAWPVFLATWILPSLTWTKLILRIRSIAEHFGLRHDHSGNPTRTVLPGFFERHFVAPRGIHHHLEHHLYPSVPWYRLPELHALLMQDDAFRERAHVTRTYWRTLREVSTPTVVPSQS